MLKTQIIRNGEPVVMDWDLDGILNFLIRAIEDDRGRPGQGFGDLDGHTFTRSYFLEDEGVKLASVEEGDTFRCWYDR